MAEEFNKNEDATPFKLQEARKKGQVAKSMELPSFFSLLFMIISLTIAVYWIASFAASRTQWWMSNAHFLAEDNAQLIWHLGSYAEGIGRNILPIILAGFVAAVVASIINTGPVFSAFPLKPDFSKMNPAKGFKKIFSRRSLVELGKLIVKVGLFVGVAYMVWKNLAPHILTTNYASLASVISNWSDVFFTLAYSLLVVFLLSTLFDLWYSRKDFARQMKMSARDIKDEVKRREGDPEIKAKRKKALSELLNKAASAKNVKDADVVITNPTHVAVALQYRPTTMVLPVVLAKGQGLVASSIRAQARRHSVPIVRKPELARALLKQVKIGSAIDVSLQNSVANVYRWIVTLPNNKVMDK